MSLRSTAIAVCDTPLRGEGHNAASSPRSGRRSIATPARNTVKSGHADPTDRGALVRLTHPATLHGPLLVWALLVLSGCSSAANPEPSPAFDGRYAGTRESNLPDACGITSATGRTSATVSGGKLRMNLFDDSTRLDGTVGEDGAVRASGLWRTPGSFHNFTVLEGRIVGGVLTGTATDRRCVTRVALTRARGGGGLPVPPVPPRQKAR